MSYSALEKLLHKAALGFGPVAETSFNLEQLLYSSNPNRTSGGHHVFIAGLARAGTTVLMRRLHASSVFRSLTYRDMPFVLAPNLWKRLGGSSGKSVEQMRAHGDGVMVSVDSPESLDEVFWRIFDGSSYIKHEALVPHSPRSQISQLYLKYISTILTGSGYDRYLCKNNNNILRLQTISATFPAAKILVPFREPFSHASSLLQQHRHLSKMQSKDRFVVEYMNWLAHHEFGVAHKPFLFCNSALSGDLDGLEYWMKLWCTTYSYLLENLPDEAVLVSYDKLCSTPDTWARIAEITHVDPNVVTDGGFKASQRELDGRVSDTIAAEANIIHEQLLNRCI